MKEEVAPRLEPIEAKFVMVPLTGSRDITWQLLSLINRPESNPHPPYHRDHGSDGNERNLSPRQRNTTQT
jgi:hypothetical protein